MRVYGNISVGTPPVLDHSPLDTDGYHRSYICQGIQPLFAFRMAINTMITKNQIHHFILHFIIEHGHAPNIPKMLETFENETRDTITSSLQALQEYHGIVLHPHDPSKVWVIHPFSLAPTNFVVSTGDGRLWFGNCAWCSLGCAALLREDCTITTSYGAHGDRVDIHIRNGEIMEDSLWIHFPICMKNAWDNVIYTCSTMLIFREKEDVQEWSLRHDVPIGDVQPIAKIWTFSKEWYGNHLDPNWVKWTATEAQDIFRRHELTHPVWDLNLSECHGHDGKTRF